MNIIASGDKQGGLIFNIQHYSVHDGPGIRTIVFLKGCPLSCAWCCNPESQKLKPELAYNSNKCIGLQECGRCLKACPHGAIIREDNNKISINRQRCQECFLCVLECPSKALHTFGDLKSIDEVLKVVEADGAFYARSGGGMTISGGEPFMQAEFPKLSILVRTPLIPGFNDSKADIMRIIDYIKDKPNVRYEILPYHPLGQPKYDYLDREYTLGGIKLDAETENNLKEIVKMHFPK